MKKFVAKIIENHLPRHTWIIVPIIVATSCFLGYVAFGYKETKLELQNTKISFEDLSKKYNKTKLTLDTQTKLLNEESEKNSSFQRDLQNISSQMQTLEKLSKTDKELLQKYSKVYFLNENYIPEKLKDIDLKYIFNKQNVIQIHESVYSFLTRLLDNASNTNIPIEINSGYRSFATQASLKSTYKISYGSGANKFSADQGYSEHQLGTTVDFSFKGKSGVLSGFEKTPAYDWLVQNAYRYGFTLSYPKNNKYYEFEPWHWRFVGVELATKLHNENKYFYDLDQREIDTYLIKIFDQIYF